MPADLPAPLLLSLVVLPASAFWSSRAPRTPKSKAIAWATLCTLFCLLAFALLRVWSAWSVPNPFGTQASELLALALALLAPTAACHLVCQASLRRGIRPGRVALLGGVSGVAVVALATVLFYPLACGLLGECA